MSVDPNDPFAGIPDDAKAQILADAGKNRAIGNQMLRDFANKLMTSTRFTCGPLERVSLLGVLATDLLAEMLVIMDENGTMGFDESLPLLMQRLNDQIDVKRSEIGKHKIIDPSAN